jgi:hypothetical protein
MCVQSSGKWRNPVWFAGSGGIACLMDVSSAIFARGNVSFAPGNVDFVLSGKPEKPVSC